MSGGETAKAVFPNKARALFLLFFFFFNQDKVILNKIRNTRLFFICLFGVFLFFCFFFEILARCLVYK